MYKEWWNLVEGIERFYYNVYILKYSILRSKYKRCVYRTPIFGRGYNTFVLKWLFVTHKINADRPHIYYTQKKLNKFKSMDYSVKINNISYHTEKIKPNY